MLVNGSYTADKTLFWLAAAMISERPAWPGDIQNDRPCGSRAGRIEKRLTHS